MNLVSFMNSSFLFIDLFSPSNELFNYYSFKIVLVSDWASYCFLFSRSFLGIFVDAEVRHREWGARTLAAPRARCEAYRAGLEVKGAFQESTENVS